MELDTLLTNRRSIRRFLPKPVEESILRTIAEAGRIAPSARNRQSWRFIAVTDADLRAEMAEACDGQRFVGTAPAIFVAVGLEDRTMSCGQSAASMDCAIALTGMMLKVTELGLGSCWLGAFSNEKVKTLLGLPEEAIVVAVLPVGYPDEAPSPRPRKALDEVFEIR